MAKAITKTHLFHQKFQTFMLLVISFEVILPDDWVVMILVYCRCQIKKIWRIASPLKRSEYLASGLVVLGINHQGNSFEESHSFMKLFSQEKFLNQSMDWLMNIESKNLRKLQTESQIFAERELQWKTSIQNLNDLIFEITA